MAADQLSIVFGALADPTRRAILARLTQGDARVAELAAPFHISLQAISRHIQVLVRAGLVQQERSGRVSRCSLDVGPMFDAAVWMNRYSKYWQDQFSLLAATLEEIDDERRARKRSSPHGARSGKKKRRKDNG